MTDAVSSSFDDTLAKLGISRTGVAGTPQVQAAGEANALGQDSFLKLLTEQMKNQDPFDPVKNEDMVAQMATFSNVAGISEMNKTLKSVVMAARNCRRLRARSNWCCGKMPATCCPTRAAPRCLRDCGSRLD